jgi:2-oxoglutarate ferredoxin oxidoreductase subunit alpha
MVSPEDYKPYDTSFGDIPPLANFGSGYKYHITGLTHDETGFPTDSRKTVASLMNRLRGKILNNKDKIIKTESFMLEDAEYVVIGYGIVSRILKTVVEKLRKEGVKIGLLRPITLFPFPNDKIAQLSERVKGMLVVEMSNGQMVDDVRLVVLGRKPIEFYGRMAVLCLPQKKYMIMQKDFGYYR